MARTSLIFALVVYAILVAFVVKECPFVIPLWLPMWNQYGEQLLLFSGVLILNLFAIAYVLTRKIVLKDTGEKLGHLEKQLRGRSTLLEELTERIAQRK